MSSDAPQVTIQVGKEQVPLPPGVTLAAWELERRYGQNPRIRSFVGSIRLLEQVMDSNFAILHCSPERLGKMRRRLARVARLVRNEITPLVARHSEIPAIEETRVDVEASTETFCATVLVDVDRLQELSLRTDEAEVRRRLCVLIGQMHSFLLDSFGKMMAGDPRSQHDADYFLSKRFPRDIEEAEWLYATVDRLQSFLASLDYPHKRRLAALARQILERGTFPDEREWSIAEDLIRLMLDDLTRKLKEILALRGIRFDEMELLDAHSVTIPAQAKLVLELYTTAREIDREIAPRDGEEEVATRARAVLGRKIAGGLIELDRTLGDLSVFVPLWLRNISLRRALMVHKVDPDDE